MHFRIDQHQAWAPTLDTHEAWEAWARQPVHLPDNNEQPACDFLPAMQRRRLSRLARMTMHVAWPLCRENEQLPFVFASRHGERAGRARSYQFDEELRRPHAWRMRCTGIVVGHRDDAQGLVCADDQSQ